MVQAGLNHTLGRIEFEDLIGKAAAALPGRLLDDLEEIGERLFVQRIESRIYPEMRELVRAHVARGHTVVLSSSALTIQVNPVARFLGITNTAHQRVRDQRRRAYSPARVLRPILWGPGKAAAVQRFAADERHRPQGQLLLRRRRRGRRPDVLGRQSTAHQPRRQDGRRRQAPRLADPEIQQPRRRWPAPAVAHTRRLRFHVPGRGRRGGNGSADRQPAAGRELLHRQLFPTGARGHRGASQCHRERESDRAASGGLYLQPPQPG